MTGPEAQTGYPVTEYPVAGYPVQFSVDYPDRPLSRLSTAFRLILVIPIAIVLAAVSGYVVFSGPSQAYGVTYTGAVRRRALLRPAADDLVLVKWLLAIPHYIVLFFLDIASFFVVIAAWFVIVITGRYPRGMFGFVEGVIRWNVRVTTYVLTLVTDRYPPFRLAP